LSIVAIVRINRGLQCKKGKLSMYSIRITIVALALVVCAAGCSDSNPDTSTSSESSEAAQDTAVEESDSDFAGLVDIGEGRKIYMECRGKGDPTVVLVSGLGDAADVWSVTSDPENERPSVFAEVATFTRVCAYDRPSTSTATGPSRSTPVPQPTSAKAAAADLAAVLTASGEPVLPRI
jgi:hypothetical protein